METAPTTAPYAPVSNVLRVIRRYRSDGFADPLTPVELTRIGVPEGNAPRTLAALRFLGLVDEAEGGRTDAFERIGRAPTKEYPAVLAEIVRASYASVFALVDPARDDEMALYDAFRTFQPQAQRSRMVTLFLGLCQEAKLVPAKPRSSRQRSTSSSTRRRPKSVEEEEGLDRRLLDGLIERLPTSGRWTQSERDRWLQALSATIDLVVEIDEEADPE